MAVKSVSIRVEEEMLRKIASVAEYEGRSLNSHVLILIRNSIQAFETEHGKIESPVGDAENVKPPRKSKK